MEVIIIIMNLFGIVKKSEELVLLPANSTISLASC